MRISVAGKSRNVKFIKILEEKGMELSNSNDVDFITNKVKLISSIAAEASILGVTKLKCQT